MKTGSGIYLISYLKKKGKVQVNEKHEKGNLKEFFGNGIFDWQLSGKKHEKLRNERCYDKEKYWGGFSQEDVDINTYKLPGWAIGPFVKHKGNPVIYPSENGWDRGSPAGGVHNGSIIRKGGKFYYIYRGEQEYNPTGLKEYENIQFDYICDIGIAYSKDGINFTKDTEHSPFFRKGEDVKYSFEDVNAVKYGIPIIFTATGGTGFDRMTHLFAVLLLPSQRICYIGIKSG
jgi:hypothetical protein